MSAENSSASSSGPEIVTVLAGGWCANMVDKDNLPGTIIGVNDSAIYARCHAAVSMDRLWTEHRWPDLVGIGRKCFIRDAALKNIHDRPEWLRPFGCNYKALDFSTDPRVLNGTNSGYCALNLAYLLKPKRVYLVGFSMNRSPNGAAYWYQPYSWTKDEGATKPGKYDEWAMQMDAAQRQFKAAGIDVANVSPSSSITAFRRLTPSQFIEERDRP